MNATFCIYEYQLSVFFFIQFIFILFKYSLQLQQIKIHHFIHVLSRWVQLLRYWYRLTDHDGNIFFPRDREKPAARVGMKRDYSTYPLQKEALNEW